MRRAHLGWISLLAVVFAVAAPGAAHAAQPVYRFYNVRNGSHFYTASTTERDTVRARWPQIYTYEGVAYSVPDPGTSGTTPVYRFYNVRNGSHFYTISPEERDTVLARWPQIYTFEGVAYSVGEPVPPAPDWTVVRGYGEIAAARINPAATYDPVLEASAIAWAEHLAQVWDTIPPGSPMYVYHSPYAPESVGREPAPEVAGVTWEVYAGGLGEHHAAHNPQLTYCGRLGVAFVQRGGFVYTVAQGGDYVGP